MGMGMGMEMGIEMGIRDGDRDGDGDGDGDGDWLVAVEKGGITFCYVPNKAGYCLQPQG